MSNLTNYYRNMNRFFGPVFDEFFPHELFDAQNRPNLPLHVDIRENETGYTLLADLPGVKKEDLHIDLKDNTMTISADFNSEQKDEHDGYICRERRRGHTERRFNVEGIDQRAITAAYENGVLTLNLPKVQPNPEKEIKHISID